eukprot:CAMPEP_0115846140 /NCGR_PEP_ID=MMETSP0287-20121206/9710_1 /TAXON_ID=412157 /ORGANISM="Chrysochromulina rotalis, Strain UIO044" /LENGTH=627 /DNA_ID=CAMNT_0003299927 /DNA_START=403 /DNA_END=2286 /DNA_ORIENTATION=-
MFVLPFLTFLDSNPLVPQSIDADARAPMLFSKFDARGDFVSDAFVGVNAFRAFGRTSHAGLLDSEFVSRPYFQMLPTLYHNKTGFLMQVLSSSGIQHPTFGDSDGPYIFASDDRTTLKRFLTPNEPKSESFRLDGHEFSMTTDGTIWSLYHDDRILDLRDGFSHNGDLMKYFFPGASCDRTICSFGSVQSSFTVLKSDYVAFCKRHPFLKVDFPGLIHFKSESAFGSKIIAQTRMYDVPSSMFALAKLSHMRPDPRCNRSSGIRYDVVFQGCLMEFEGDAMMGFGQSVVGPEFNANFAAHVQQPNLTGSELLATLRAYPGGYEQLVQTKGDKLTCRELYRPGCKSSLDPFHFNAFAFSPDGKYVVLSSYFNHETWFLEARTLKPLFTFKTSSNIWEDGSYNLMESALTKINGSYTFNDDGAAFYQHGTRFVTVMPGGGAYSDDGKYRLLMYCNGLNRYSWQLSSHAQQRVRAMDAEQAFNPLMYKMEGTFSPGQSSRCVEIEIELPRFEKGILKQKGSASLVWSAKFEDVYPSSDIRFRHLVKDGRTMPMVAQIEGQCERFNDGTTGISWGINVLKTAGTKNAAINNQPFFSLVQTIWNSTSYQNVPIFDISTEGASVAFARVVPQS